VAVPAHAVDVVDDEVLKTVAIVAVTPDEKEVPVVAVIQTTPIEAESVVARNETELPRRPARCRSLSTPVSRRSPLAFAFSAFSKPRDEPPRFRNTPWYCAAGARVPRREKAAHVICATARVAPAASNPSSPSTPNSSSFPPSSPMPAGFT